LGGEFRDGQMVLEGLTIRRDGQQVRQRITWTPLPDGRVRQHRNKPPDRQTWTTAFDGRHSRR
jgi:hypothetical protein